MPVAPESAGKTGGFFCVADDDIRTEFMADGRQLFPQADIDMAAPIPPPVPDSAPEFAASALDLEADTSNDGGKVLKRRTSVSKGGKLSRSSSVGSARGRRGSASSEKAPAKPKAPEQPVLDHPPRWWIDVKEGAVWTIIGVESVRRAQVGLTDAPHSLISRCAAPVPFQVRYTFVIPRLRELQPAALSGPALHLGALVGPVTPLPALLRYLQPKPLGQNEESINIKGYDMKFLSRTTRKMITL
jgi:hypothetical protein